MSLPGIHPDANRILVAITGASGSLYGTRLIESLVEESNLDIHLMISSAGLRVMTEELGVRPRLFPFDPNSFLNIAKGQSGRIHYHPAQDSGAGPASGTFLHQGMVVCPCSMKTLGEISNGIAGNLISRSADVTIKEQRKLILVPRETPFSAIHLENMLRLSQAGAVILPANPGFYHQPQSIDDLVKFIIQKILDLFGIRTPNPIRWN
jgi:4-hydroxy-3-polyprenylbenzoate decarboxylase